jgi:superoxide dismutase, Fe-Mn family
LAGVRLTAAGAGDAGSEDENNFSPSGVIVGEKEKPSAQQARRNTMQSVTRRHLVAATAGIAAATLAPRIVVAQAPAPAPAPAPGPFKRDPLPYPANALEPHIDAKTMEIHPERHHQAYVNNLNNAAKDHPQIGQKPIPEVLAKLNEVPEAIRTVVRNNLGGHANHMMFWQIMGAGGGKPSGEVAAAIDRDLGGLEKFQNDFNAAGGRVFGSGWVFVTVDRTGKLALETKPNQDTPLMDGKRVLIGNDVWEHAYYLNYQNRRADYLKAWWNVVNWNKVAERYAAAKAGTLAV